MVNRGAAATYPQSPPRRLLQATQSSYTDHTVTYNFLPISSVFFSSSACNRSRTRMSAFPSKFSPQLFLLASAFAAPYLAQFGISIPICSFKKVSYEMCLGSKSGSKMGILLLQHVSRLKKQSLTGRDTFEKCLTPLPRFYRTATPPPTICHLSPIASSSDRFLLVG